MKNSARLRDVQVWMVSAITGTEVNRVNPERFVTRGPRMSAAERLEVYRSAYRARLVECLRDDYPVLARTLGDDRFESLARAYIERHPSSSPNLNRFGGHVPRFVREQKMSWAGIPARFASELASLEWSIVEVVHADASDSLDVSELQRSPPERWAGAHFVSSEAVRLHRFEYPVNAYYQARLERDDVTGHAVPLPSPSVTVVYRKNVKVWRMDLTPMMASVLTPLLSGEPLEMPWRASSPSSRASRTQEPWGSILPSGSVSGRRQACSRGSNGRDTRIRRSLCESRQVWILEVGPSRARSAARRSTVLETTLNGTDKIAAPRQRPAHAGG